MDKIRRNKLMWRWSMMASGFTALFWGIWYTITGEIPAVTTIRPFLFGEEIAIPFGISHLWDIPASALVAIVIIRVIAEAPDTKDTDNSSNKKDIFILATIAILFLIFSACNTVIVSLIFFAASLLLLSILDTIYKILIDGIVYLSLTASRKRFIRWLLAKDDDDQSVH